MSKDNEIIDVQIERRELPLREVSEELASFANPTMGYYYTIPRNLWVRKGRPMSVFVSAEVVL